MNISSPSLRIGLTKWLPRLALAIWAPALLVVCAFLLVGHWITLPLPAGDDPKLARSIQDQRAYDEMGQWMAVHVLYARCDCSKRIIEHILDRAPVAGVKEKIILVEHQPRWEALAQEKHIPVQVISRDELKSIYNIPAAPIMVVADPHGTIRYAGGYTARKQGPDIRDVAVISDVMQQHPAAPIPLFGCAVSATLSAMLDPLGIKELGKRL